MKHAGQVVDTYFDLCGWVLFPGSSNVHAELDVKHDWHGCPSSHFILLRLGERRQRAVYKVVGSQKDGLTDNDRTLCTDCGVREDYDAEIEDGVHDLPAQFESSLLENGRSRFLRSRELLVLGRCLLSCLLRRSLVYGRRRHGWL